VAAAAAAGERALASFGVPAALQRLAESWGAEAGEARRRLVGLVQADAAGMRAGDSEGEEMMSDLRVTAASDGPMKSVSDSMKSVNDSMKSVSDTRLARRTTGCLLRELVSGSTDDCSLIHRARLPRPAVIRRLPPVTLGPAPAPRWHGRSLA
jgi:hypothetical protein